MTPKTTRALLIALCCILAVILAGLVIFVITCEDAPEAPAPTQPTTVETTPPTEITTQPTVETTVVTEPTEVTTEPATEPPTEPQPISYTLSFVGDCVLTDVNGRTGPLSFEYEVGTNYDYPFLNVADFFRNDDYTFANLECALSLTGPTQDKRYVVDADPAYAAVFTGSGIEFANIVNNHTMDRGKEGYQNTLKTLNDVGLHYVEEGKTGIFTTESGLVIGVYTDYFPDSASGVKKGVAKLKDAGAEVIIACFHWGTEYHYKPSAANQKIARAAVDAGADIVYGHHPHVLQPIEEYNGGVIYYSLGNFAFGKAPPDKDSAIIQQEIIREPDGTVHLGQRTVIPCCVSGDENTGNYFQPYLLKEDSAAYARVLRKLSGTYEKDVLVVSWREDLYPDATEPTEPSTEPTEPGDPADPTDPEPTPSEPTPDPSEPAPEPSEPTPEPSEPDPEPPKDPDPEPEGGEPPAV